MVYFADAVAFEFFVIPCQLRLVSDLPMALIVVKECVVAMDDTAVFLVLVDDTAAVERLSLDPIAMAMVVVNVNDVGQWYR